MCHVFEKTSAMNLIRIGLLVVLLAVFRPLAAGVPPDQLAEIEHLISYLETSGCVMIRNGKSHSGEEGAKHVRRKYEHFRKKLNSTEQFIELSASGSSISGRKYTVECPGESAITSQEWLLSELARYRQASEG
jgi:hypothetical protein